MNTRYKLTFDTDDDGNITKITCGGEKGNAYDFCIKYENGNYFIVEGRHISDGYKLEKIENIKYDEILEIKKEKLMQKVLNTRFMFSTLVQDNGNKWEMEYFPLGDYVYIYFYAQGERFPNDSYRLNKHELYEEKGSYVRVALEQDVGSNGEHEYRRLSTDLEMDMEMIDENKIKILFSAQGTLLDGAVAEVEIKK